MVDAPAHSVTNELDQQHEDTYRHFQLAVRWAMVLNASIGAFLVLLFCTDAGFISSFVVFAVVLGLGLYWIAHRKAFDDISSHRS